MPDRCAVAFPRASGLVMAALLALVVSPAPAAAGSRGVVYVVTLGDFPADLGDAVERAVAGELQVEVKRIDRVPLPAAAYYKPRKRYRAEKLLEYLHTVMRERAPEAPRDARILAMTDVDISTTKGKVYDWGVFGLGELPGRSCVISVHRLRRGARDAAHLRFRVTTTGVHEVGHTLGLPHCTEPRCVMQDAEGSIKNTDGSSGHLGSSCRALLDRNAPQR